MRSLFENLQAVRKFFGFSGNMPALTSAQSSALTAIGENIVSVNTVATEGGVPQEIIELANTHFAAGHAILTNGIVSYWKGGKGY